MKKSYRLCSDRGTNPPPEHSDQRCQSLVAGFQTCSSDKELYTRAESRPVPVYPALGLLLYKQETESTVGSSPHRDVYVWSVPHGV